MVRDLLKTIRKIFYLFGFFVQNNLIENKIQKFKKKKFFISILIKTKENIQEN
jgi:hypothetical protein